MSCPPSAKLEQGFPNKTSPYAEEGTLAHSLSELKLRKAIGELSEQDYTTEFNKVAPKVDTEMQNATTLYVDLVLERFNDAKSRSQSAVMLIERRLDFSKYVPKGFGTGDIIIISDGSIEVIDLKYGKGVPVYAEENPQMRLYALGAYEQFDVIYDLNKVTYMIIQPRLDSVSAESISTAELVDWANNEVVPRAKLAWDGLGEYHSGEHCRFCRAAAVCRARADAALAAIKYEFSKPPILEEEEIPTILPLLDDLISWAKDLKAYAYEKALGGTTWQGYKLVAGRSNRAYTDEKAVAEMLMANGIKEEEIYDRSLLSLTTLESKLGKAFFREATEGLITKPAGKPTLVPEHDRRETFSSAKQDFSSLED